MFAFAQGLLPAETVLNFRLTIIGEAIAERGIDPPDIVAPPRAGLFFADGAEELLVPPQRAVKLRSEFVFRFAIIGERVGISNAGDFEPATERRRCNRVWP
jgi:hypothetical protein